MLVQAYPWMLLDVAKPWSVTFSSSGTYARHLVKFSLSGIPHADDLVVYLGGVDLGWMPRDGIGLDRWHYDVFFEHGLTEGEHAVEFILRNKEIQGQVQLCSVEVLEYGSLEDLFPTYDLNNATSYRPSNDDCLMRSIVNPNFCSVCLEELWLSLVKRINLIDYMRWTCPRPGSQVHVVQVDLVKLAHLREEPIESAESYAIEWTRNGRVPGGLMNLTQVELNGTDYGAYREDVAYTVDQVRSDPRGYLRASRTFDLTPHSC